MAGIFQGLAKTNTPDEEAMLRNALRIADHHRKHCDGIDCNISLNLLFGLLDAAGIEVTPEERERFL